MPQQITDKTANKILRCTEKMCDLVDEGLSPNEAAIKVAKESSLTRGQVELMCQAHNAGAVNAQRREGESFAEKFAAVAQADAESVNAQLFPTRPDTSHKRSKVAAVYRTPEPSSSNKKQSAEAVQQKDVPKSDIFPAGRKTAYFSADPTPYRQATAKLDNLRALRRGLDQAQQFATQKTAAVEDAIRHSYKDPTAELPWLRKVAQYYYGNTGRKVIERAASFMLPLLKYADFRQESWELIPSEQPKPIDRNHPVMVALKTAVEAIQDWASKEAEFPRQAIEIRREINKIYGKGRKEATIKLPLPGKTAEESEQIRWEKKANILAGLTAGFASQAFKGKGPTPEPPPELISARLKLNDPTHDAELRTIRAEGMLNDLMSSDEVISSHSPEDVAVAFMELAQSSPDALDNIALLRANLRRNLQGTLTPHEAKDLSSLRAPQANPTFNAPGTFTPSASKEKTPAKSDNQNKAASLSAPHNDRSWL